MLLKQRKDWSRRQPRPLVIPKVMKLTTLADVRELMRHLPADGRNMSTWQQVGPTSTRQRPAATWLTVALAVRLVLMLERVECRPG